MQLPEFRQALEDKLSAQSVARVLASAYDFQVAQNNNRTPRARYGTVKMTKEADSMWETVVSNILAGMSANSDRDILQRLADDEFIAMVEEGLEKINFTTEF